MHDARQTIERYVDALAAQDFDAALGCFAPDAVWEHHTPGWDAQSVGHEEIAARLYPWFIAREQYEIVGYDLVDHGETVALRWEQHWRNPGDGYPCTCHQSHFFQVTDGQIQRQWMYCAGVTVWEPAPDSE